MWGRSTHREDLWSSKQWIVDKIKELASVFAIDVCAYAVMSNYYHVVVRVGRERVARWDDEAVIERWRKLFTGGLLIERYIAGEQQTAAERDRISELAAQWRNWLEARNIKDTYKFDTVHIRWRHSADAA